MKHSRAIGQLVAATLVWVWAACPSQAGSVEQVNQRFGDLVARCAQYGERLKGVQWKSHDKAVWEGEGKTWSPVNTHKDRISTVQVDGQAELHVGMNGGWRGTIDSGLTVSGQCVIELEGRITTERICDLSIALDMPGGPGFDFGSCYNEHNVILVERQSDHGMYRQEMVVSDARQIVRNRWHTVRLEITDKAMIASVDGYALGQTALDEKYDFEKQRRVLFYTIAGDMEVRRLEVWSQRIPADQNVEHVPANWKKSFGDMTEAQVQSELRAMVDMLDHNEFAVRERVQAMLTQVGPMAEPMLRQAMGSGSTEQRWRATLIVEGPDAAFEK